MKECSTYMIMLPHSEAAICEEEFQRIRTVLQKFSSEDLFVSIWPTPLNNVCKFTVAITILRSTLEEAGPVCDSIMERLREAGELPVQKTTTLLYGEDESKVYVDLGDYTN